MQFRREKVVKPRTGNDQGMNGVVEERRKWQRDDPTVADKISRDGTKHAGPLLRSRKNPLWFTVKTIQRLEPSTTLQFPINAKRFSCFSLSNVVFKRDAGYYIYYVHLCKVFGNFRNLFEASLNHQFFYQRIIHPVKSVFFLKRLTWKGVFGTKWMNVLKGVKKFAKSGLGRRWMT